MGSRLGLVDGIFRSAIWPLWARRDDANFLRFAEIIERSQNDSSEVVAARQTVRLRRLVTHAVATVPYYREQFNQLGLKPDDIRCVNDLGQLPTLSKQDVRDRRDELLSEHYRHQPRVTKKTSGSTGVPLRVELDEAGLAWKRATTLLADEWSGWQRGTRVARVWGNPEYRQFGMKGWLRNLAYDRAIHLDTLKMNDQDLQRFAERLRRFQPKLIFGHAHSVFLLARYLRDTGQFAPAPTGIITTAMILHDFQRRVIEEVFRCRVTNRYGCEEVSLIASECGEHQGLHVNVENVIVELLDGDRPVRAGEPGHVVITDLANYAMPLLRYRVGDVAIWSDEKCSCGRAAPCLARIEGREADYVVTASGHYISGISLTENFATLVPGVAQLQIVQEQVDRFHFRIVRAPEFAEDRLAALVRERFGPATKYDCEFVERIAPEPSGKYRFCISHVARLPRSQAA